MNAFVTVRLDESDVLQAERWEVAILGTGLESRPNYTGISQPHRYRNGYLGELALSAWFRSVHVAHNHRVRLDGASDAPEFDVSIGGSLRKIDVKACSDPVRHRKMMIPESQKLDSSIYVGARLAARHGDVELHGWVPRAVVARVPIADFGYGPTRALLLASLRPMDALAAILDKSSSTGATP